MCPKMRIIIFYCLLLAYTIDRVWVLPVPMQNFADQGFPNANENSIRTTKLQESLVNKGHQHMLEENEIGLKKSHGDLTELERKERQVVQPKWLTFPDISSNAKGANVRVTNENLRETAAIRKLIQNAVRQNQLKVNTNSPNSRSSAQHRNRPITKRPSIARASKKSSDNAAQWAQWSFQLPPPLNGHFAFGQLSQSNEQLQQQQQFLNEMERIWQIFVQQTEQWLQQFN